LCQPNYQDGCALAGLIGQYSPGGIGSDRPSEKRKVVSRVACVPLIAGLRVCEDFGYQLDVIGPR
jgi:hypothetical protein